MSKGDMNHTSPLVRLRKELPFHLMLLPGVLLVLVFKYIPMVGLSIAFQDYSPLFGIFDQDWCGLENFRYIFSLSTVTSLSERFLLFPEHDTNVTIANEDKMTVKRMISPFFAACQFILIPPRLAPHTVSCIITTIITNAPAYCNVKSATL